jgi:serine/threonine protein kinase/tetratricopeptide (TPR) repeat protein
MNADDDRTRTYVQLTSGTMVSHYRIIEKIGAGGMGEVYLAEDTKLDRKVALKFLPQHLCQNADCRARFTREAQATAKLSHPNIVTIFEVSDFNGRPFFAMEHVEGLTLKDVIAGKPLPIDRIIEIGIQVCEGLQAAHEKGITHRDIKPSNILIDSHGRARIVDFGLASVLGTDQLTKTGSTLGTIGYMSPEQVRGDKVDHRTDLFSFGVVLYEMITGHSPFKADSEAATLHAITNTKPDLLARYRREVPPEVQTIIDKALEKDVATRYQHADEIATDLKRLTSPSTIEGAPRRKKWSRYVVTSAALLVVVIGFVFLTHKSQTSRTSDSDDAVAGEATVAIMYFENLADRDDKARLGEIVTNLLITSLSESHYFRVISSQRLYDILKSMDKEGITVIDKSVASEVARKAHAKWMVLGSILEVEPRLVITTQFLDVKSGQVEASERIAGRSKEDVFSMVDTLAIGIKQSIPLTDQARKEVTPGVANVTTHSPDAYRYYLEAWEAGRKFEPVEAEKNYRKALSFDSTFAMAYYGLADLKGEQGEGLEQKKMIAKAVQYSANVSQKERYYIESLAKSIRGEFPDAIRKLKLIVERYPDEKDACLQLASIYNWRLRDYKEAAYWYNKAIEIDPREKIAFNNLAYCYASQSEFENSIHAVNQYVSLAPNEPNPYDSRGDIYAYSGKIDEAAESYREALKIRPDFDPSLAKLGLMHLFKLEYAQADSCFEVLSGSSNKTARSTGRTTLALIPLYQGKFKEALKMLDNGLSADEMEQFVGEPRAIKHALKAYIYEEQKIPDLAVAEARTSTEILRREYPADPVYLRDLYAYMLLQQGQYSKAEEVTESLKEAVGGNAGGANYAYWLASGLVEGGKGNRQAAMAGLEKAINQALGYTPLTLVNYQGVWSQPLFQTRFLLAKECLELGRLDEAVATLEKALLTFDEGRAVASISAVKAHYLLGLAYERSGWTAKAIAQYDIFLDIWKDADPGIKEVDDAKARLAGLKAKSKG